MRYLGLDYGSKTCGVSISDESLLISSPLEVIRYNNMDELIIKLKRVFDSYNISLIVLGNPLNLDGSLSKRSEETIKFKSILESSFNVKVELQDERLSTVEAEKILIESGKRRDKRKKVIDKMASTIILQSYLDRSG